MIVITAVEDEKVLKFNGTSSNAQNSANLAHHNDNSLLACYGMLDLVILIMTVSGL